MSSILLINATIPLSPRVAVLKDQKLVHLDVESQQPNRTNTKVPKNSAKNSLIKGFSVRHLAPSRSTNAIASKKILKTRNNTN